LEFLIIFDLSEEGLVHRNVLAGIKINDCRT